ncbi:MAG: 2-oxoacid:acceptor oxidoreductase subunit alpha [Rhodocyclaceae bacterium]|jgi:2-oxoglutarate ferredoxin oxidoreductase subunit alpha|nr:2-oxoacid:acceptor oxidoreductase subunit alpha [Rhodocyclaceae bacterium]
MDIASFSLIVAGSGGAGAISTGAMLLEAAGRIGWYGYMTRSVGAQIRGGEAVGMVRFSREPIVAQSDNFQVLLALDWQNLGKYAAEFPLSPSSLIIGDPEQGEVPGELLASGARCGQIAMKALAQAIPAGRPNMVALGILGALAGLPAESIDAVLLKTMGHKGDKALAASRAAIQAGWEAAGGLPVLPRLAVPDRKPEGGRWLMTGNEAAGYGAVKGGIRYVAAYPITPATEVLEWMAPALDKIGGTLVQVEDELAAINQIIGASYGGVPSLTATAGPGLALMTESLGLAVASETPIVVVDVMRGGPSTGIPAKSEQSDLNIALYGLHGDAPHLVVAPNSVVDCMFTTQWAVHLAETLQTVALVLSDQALGQARVAGDRPAEVVFPTRREVAAPVTGSGKYQRYAVTPSGVSPMAVPGTAGCQYTADGLEHNPFGTPSSQASDHQAQLDKRQRKLTQYDYGNAWADLEGEGDIAILTWGSCTGAAREAIGRLRATGLKVRLLSLRLLFPVQPEKFAAALQGVKRLLIVEQTHSGQFMRYLRAFYDLPCPVQTLNRPGPLPIRPNEIEAQLAAWSST